MHIKNTTDGLIAFRITLPSQRVFRIEIGGGETIDVSNAVKIGLGGSAYYQTLVGEGRLTEIDPNAAEESEGDGDVPRKRKRPAREESEEV